MSFCSARILCDLRMQLGGNNYSASAISGGLYGRLRSDLMFGETAPGSVCFTSGNCC